jgi:uncharacterized membrane protein
MLNAWLHVISLIVYLGAVFGLPLVLLPALSSISDHDAKVDLLTRALKLYNPLHIGALGIVLFTGAFQLTALKAAYREHFIQQFGFTLAIKLLFVFFLVIFSVYQSMAIGHRFVRLREGGEAVTPEQLVMIVRRLNTATGCILVLAAISMWLGITLGLSHP